jgi:hypothetical protein
MHQDTAVDLERLDGCPPDRSPPDDARARGAPAEVLIPAIRTRIEQGDDPSGARIVGLSASLLVKVTLGAAVAQIGGVIRSAT